MAGAHRLPISLRVHYVFLQVFPMAKTGARPVSRAI
jgi:hypothetical protein